MCDSWLISDLSFKFYAKPCKSLTKKSILLIWWCDSHIDIKKLRVTNKVVKCIKLRMYRKQKMCNLLLIYNLSCKLYTLNQIFKHFAPQWLNDWCTKSRVRDHGPKAFQFASPCKIAHKLSECTELEEISSLVRMLGNTDSSSKSSSTTSPLSLSARNVDSGPIQS